MHPSVHRNSVHSAKSRAEVSECKGGSVTRYQTSPSEDAEVEVTASKHVDNKQSMQVPSRDVVVSVCW